MHFFFKCNHTQQAEIMGLVGSARQSSSSQSIDHHIYASWQVLLGGRIAHAREPSPKQNKLNTSPDSLLAEVTVSKSLNAYKPGSHLHSRIWQRSPPLRVGTGVLCQALRPHAGVTSSQLCSSELCSFFPHMKKPRLSQAPW